ncbi:MAG: orotate phosphoribosyltransferase [Cyclobacteriaceae bacterium]|nr:MAG: orotate phosphoribosyltransferase [Cyclobacteriaceae bacterium]
MNFTHSLTEYPSKMSSVTIFSPSARPVANMLLDCGAVRIRPDKPFIWASGWKSPIYCDNRITLSFPKVRTTIKNFLAEALKSFFPEAGAVAGVATAGIPQAALLADALNIPLAYVRSSAKDHGMENLIEGQFTAGQQVVVVEDLVSTGGSSLKAVAALRAANIRVLGMLSVFTYGFEAAEKQFAENRVKLVSLSDYYHLLEEAQQKQLINSHHLTLLKAWRYDPASWNM